jgi:hypothetical protein
MSLDEKVEELDSSVRAQLISFESRIIELIQREVGKALTSPPRTPAPRIPPRPTPTPTPTRSVHRSFMMSPSSVVHEMEQKQSIFQSNSVDDAVEDVEPQFSTSEVSQLQKGLAKPSDFFGEESKGERITTWWRSVWVYSSVYPVASRAMLIKSYLKGTAAVWLESREIELGRSMSVDELKNGLAIEYGSDTTSDAALQSIKNLNMADNKYSTIQTYNAEFNRLYSLLKKEALPIAVNAYIGGVFPRIQREIIKPNSEPWTLQSARIAVGQAVSKCETIDLAYKRFEIFEETE